MSQLPIETLLQNLRHLRLKDMADHLPNILDEAQKQRQGHLGFLSSLLEAQLQGAQQRSLNQRLKKGCFSSSMTSKTSIGISSRPSRGASEKP